VPALLLSHRRFRRWLAAALVGGGLLFGLLSSAEPPQVARADRLAAYRLLSSLGSLPDDRMQATALLEPLLTGRPAM